MTPANVVLIRLPQASGGPPKLRPALVLAELPGPFQSRLMCGISTRLRDIQPRLGRIDWPGRCRLRRVGTARAIGDTPQLSLCGRRARDFRRHRPDRGGTSAKVTWTSGPRAG